jgi:hypothetical protein
MILCTRVSKAILIVAACALLSTGVVLGSPLTVDGDASDWGFSVADNNASTWVPAGGIGLVGMMLEDSDDLAGDGGYVGPNQGGQNYDGEVLAAAVQGSDLYIIIVSGQRPDNGLARFGPGDLRIMTNSSDYGVEIGGGAGGGPGTMLVGGESGSTYTLDSNGFTIAHNVAALAQTAGSVWQNPTWIFDPIPPQEQTQMQIAGGTFAGTSTYRFTRDSSTTQHSIIEMAIPMSVFGGATIENIVWFPACGNDELMLQTSIVPEPATWALALTAAAGIVPLARWRGSRQRVCCPPAR